MSDLLGIDPRTISESTRMTTVPTWDSLGHINLCVCLEREFNVMLTASDLEAMVTYSGILHVLEKAIERN